MSKSIFTMSAAQRLKAQERQSKRFDRAVNRKFKAMKKAWKKKIAGKVVKGAAFVTVAAATGVVVSKAKEIVRTKSRDELREMAAKIKVKFEEKKTAGKKSAADTAEEAAMGNTAGEAVKTAAENVVDAAAALGKGASDGVGEAAKANAEGENLKEAAGAEPVLGKGTSDGVSEAAEANAAPEQ